MKPSEEGMKRYDNGVYIANGDNTLCMCESNCVNPCKGRCGCQACNEAYGDYLSSQ